VRGFEPPSGERPEPIVLGRMVIGEGAGRGGHRHHAPSRGGQGAPRGGQGASRGGRGDGRNEPRQDRPRNDSRPAAAPAARPAGSHAPHAAPQAQPQNRGPAPARGNDQRGGGKPQPRLTQPKPR
jgi:ATP-dependent RNA helicase RhlE